MTKPFLRTSEFLWQEGHTAHSTKDEAEKEVTLILNIYRELMEQMLAIPVIVGRKTEAEKFVGADYTLTLEAMMPDGRALQMGTSHFLGQNFSKPFEITFLDQDEKQCYVWQTSWGVSTRMLGAIVMVHGDDKGLVLPPKIAPIQVVIIPIYYGEKEKLKVSQKIVQYSDTLSEAQIRVFVDDREAHTPGWKFNEWEMKGIPLRIEVGPKDVTANQVTVARRDTGEKLQIDEADIVSKTNELLLSIQNTLFSKAKITLESTEKVECYDELKKIIDTKGGFVLAGWCGNPDCEGRIKNETGTTIRALPITGERKDSSCIICGKKATAEAYYARSY
jgi:prolyl-tRNA synthetase